MKFRIYREYDLDKVEALDRKVFSIMDPEIDLQGMWWTARSQGVPVAYAGMKLYRTDNGIISYFHRVGVVPDFRRHGLHQRLIRTRIKAAKEQGCVSAITYTMYYNAISNNNLINAGFRQYYPDYTWVGVDDVIYWRKQL